jgi:hypothetical protein
MYFQSVEAGGNNRAEMDKNSASSLKEIPFSDNFYRA